MKKIKQSLALLAVVATGSTLLTGCGGSSNSDSDTPTDPPTTPISNSLLGSAFKGSIDAATVMVMDASGTVLGTGTSTKGKFEFKNISLPADTEAVFINTKDGQYTDEATGQKVMLGSHGLMTVFLASELKAIMTAKQVVALTPETTMMAMLVKKSMAAGTTATKAIADAKIIIQAEWIDGTNALPIFEEGAPLLSDDLLLVGDLSTSVSASIAEGLAKNRAMSFSYEAKWKKLAPLQVFELISKTADDLSDGTLDGKDHGVALTYMDSKGMSHDLSKENRNVQYGLARFNLLRKTLDGLFTGKLSENKVAELEVLGFETSYVEKLRAKDAAMAKATITNLSATNLPDFNHLPTLEDEDGDPNDNKATYSLTADSNVIVGINTPGRSWNTPMMRYNNHPLPPIIRAKRNDVMTLNITNNLVPIETEKREAKEGEAGETENEITTVHWHGFKIPGPQDGGPDFPVNAGESKQYNFTMLQPAAPLWFHPHPFHKTGNQVYQGLAGVFLLSDDITKKLEDDKQLPSGKYDIPLLVQDRRFAEEKDGIRKLVYMGGPTDHNGMLAHIQLVNGAQLPKLEVETRQYRFRLYSVGNARTYIFSLSNNAPFTIVGTDGGLLDKPVEVTSVTLSAAERAEIIVDFSKYAVGDKVMLISKAFNGSPLMPLLVPRMRHGGIPEGVINALPVDGSYADIMRFDITTQATDDISLYTALPDYADINKDRLTAKDATKTRKFVMEMTSELHFTINGKVVELGRIDEYVKLSEGDTEIWSIENRSGSAHPFHAHAIQWQVLSRNGEPATGMELGWKDTVYLRPGETVDLIGRFDPVVNYGDYMYHCHMLEHEDAGMMGMFNIEK